jgi:hypothetical protein
VDSLNDLLLRSRGAFIHLYPLLSEEIVYISCLFRQGFLPPESSDSSPAKLSQESILGDVTLFPLIDTGDIASPYRRDMTDWSQLHSCARNPLLLTFGI